MPILHDNVTVYCLQLNEGDKILIKRLHELKRYAALQLIKKVPLFARYWCIQRNRDVSMILRYINFRYLSIYLSQVGCDETFDQNVVFFNELCVYKQH